MAWRKSAASSQRCSEGRTLEADDTDWKNCAGLLMKRLGLLMCNCWFVDGQRAEVRSQGAPQRNSVQD